MDAGRLCPHAVVEQGRHLIVEHFRHHADVLPGLGLWTARGSGQSQSIGHYVHGELEQFLLNAIDAQTQA